MNSIRNKLKNNRGSSIIIALGLFMICAMISSVVVVAAASGSSRNVERIERQRAYLSVSSAAQIIMDELSDIKEKKYVGRQERNLYICNDIKSLNPIKQSKEYEGVLKEGYVIDEGYLNALSITNIKNDGTAIMLDEPHPNGTSFKSITYDEEDVLKDTAEGLDEKDNLEFLVLKAAEEIFVWGRKQYEKEFKILVEGADERFSAVNCKFRMGEDYNIMLELTLADSKYAYAMTIDMKAVTTIIPENGYATEEDTTNGCEHLICCTEDDGAGIIKYHVETEAFFNYCVKEFKQTTVTWNAPVLSKGVITAS